ncbi:MULTISPECIES: hypothetical protein [Microvirga]|uniref:hypothetical protein n=1 Tax=Microvirga TaxID=186650 RepID=UPI001CFDB59C|nr:hypothetical protein [Microvirga lenta]MCB5174592.1 hypothetical protein [Microvirga lenta]
MRILTAAVFLALLAGPQAALAQPRTAPDMSRTKADTLTPFTSKESAALADRARERSEALERARDHRMKTLTRSICTGC